MIKTKRVRFALIEHTNRVEKSHQSLARKDLNIAKSFPKTRPPCYPIWNTDDAHASLKSHQRSSNNNQLQTNGFVGKRPGQINMKPIDESVDEPRLNDPTCPWVMESESQC